MNTVQELFDFMSITLRDIQAMLFCDDVRVDDLEEIFESSCMSDEEYPTKADEEWLHIQLVNDGDL